jgi:hypothetical protein
MYDDDAAGRPGRVEESSIRSQAVLRGVLLLILCAAAAWCADIGGQWTAE